MNSSGWFQFIEILVVGSNYSNYKCTTSIYLSVITCTNGMLASNGRIWSSVKVNLASKLLSDSRDLQNVGYSVVTAYVHTLILW